MYGTHVAGALSELDERVAQLVSDNPALGNAAIGRLAGIVEETACRIRRKEAVAARIAVLAAEKSPTLQTRLHAAGEVGLQTLIELARQSQRGTVRLRAAQTLVELLARTPQPEKVSVKVDLRQQLATALGVRAADGGKIVEITSQTGQKTDESASGRM